MALLYGRNLKLIVIEVSKCYIIWTQRVLIVYSHEKSDE